MNPGRGMQEQEPDQASSQMLLYLAQRDMAEVLPELAANIPLAPPFPGLAERLHQRSIWLGCSGTQTPLHHDPYHNLFCQASIIHFFVQLVTDHLLFSNLRQDSRTHLLQKSLLEGQDSADTDCPSLLGISAVYMHCSIIIVTPVCANCV